MNLAEPTTVRTGWRARRRIRARPLVSLRCWRWHSAPRTPGARHAARAVRPRRPPWPSRDAVPPPPAAGVVTGMVAHRSPARRRPAARRPRPGCPASRWAITTPLLAVRQVQAPARAWSSSGASARPSFGPAIRRRIRLRGAGPRPGMAAIVHRTGSCPGRRDAPSPAARVPECTAATIRASVARVLHRLRADLGDHVAGLHAGGGGRAVLLHLGHQRAVRPRPDAARTPSCGRHRLRAHAQPAALHLAVRSPAG